MPQSWHCEQGHPVGPSKKQPNSCPVCGSRNISRDVLRPEASASGNGTNLDETLQRPAVAVQVSSTSTAPAKSEAAVSEGSLDETLAPASGKRIATPSITQPLP